MFKYKHGSRQLSQVNFEVLTQLKKHKTTEDLSYTVTEKLRTCSTRLLFDRGPSILYLFLFNYANLN